MFIVTATNVTRDRDTTNRIEWNSLEREDGTADYDVSVGINDFVIWRGSVNSILLLLLFIIAKFTSASEKKP